MLRVIKANGETEAFSEEKLLHSIHRAGIPQSIQQEVISHVKSKLYEHIPTKEIYHHITEFLGTSPSPYTKAKYSLKQAIMKLGPTGYPFEDYIGKILFLQGYQTQTRKVLQGTCVTHEIDVIAEKHTVLPNKIMVEAKFHNELGIKTNIHVSMYTKARFDDVKEKNNFSEAWLVTNTKATLDAIAYASCVGMKIITWSHPEGESLRDLVEKFHVYPITALNTISEKNKQELLSQGIVLCKEICEQHTVLEPLGLSQELKQQVIHEATFLCCPT